MPALMADIQRWLDKLYDPEGEYTHMVVRCDTFEYRGSPYDKCCYPVYFIAKSFEDTYKQANDTGDTPSRRVPIPFDSNKSTATQVALELLTGLFGAASFEAGVG